MSGSAFVDYRDHVGAAPETFHKATLFRGSRLLVGLNCLEPGQTHAVHTHADQDKVYCVLEGTGLFTVGSDRRSAGPGTVVWAAAGAPHGVENRGQHRLVVLVGIAPAPGG
jgi:quercetin dioxygenase-like cupin family protein